MDITVILPCVIGGVGWSIMGYLQAKASSTPKEPISFDLRKLAKSVIVGGALGAYLGFTGVTANVTALDQIATSSTIYLPIVAVADKIVTVVYNAIRRVI